MIYVLRKWCCWVFGKVGEEDALWAANPPHSCQESEFQQASMLCTVIGGVAKGWGNWIGIRQWLADNKRYPSFSWLFRFFFAARRVEVYVVVSKQGREDRKRATRTGGVWWFPLEAQWLCSARIRMHEPQSPPPPKKSPGVICVIITIITLRLQEISAKASEEKPCRRLDAPRERRTLSS